MNWKVAAIAVPSLLAVMTLFLWILTLTPWYDPEQANWLGVIVGYAMLTYGGFRLGMTDE